MSPLRQALADYLQIRRALGFRLERAEKLLGQFVTYLEEHHAVTVTTEHALAWATLPGGAPWWHALRLSAARGFTAWLHALDGRAEIPPAGLIPPAPHRATPYLYSDAEITALISAAARLPGRVNALTYPVLISLLAVTGMRIGEAIALDDADFDPAAGILTVRHGKFGKARLLPLHPTTTAALVAYRQVRDQVRPHRPTDALLISSAGARLRYNRAGEIFRRLAGQAGLTPRSPACRPRAHDLRHSFAVTSLLSCYRAGGDAQALLPALATYLGHADPKHTFWYLTGAPELLSLAAGRLEAHSRGTT